jgi:hypothetical protein
VAVLQSDVYDYRDKDSAAMLKMSVPSFKLLLHGARARLKQIASAGLIAPRKTSRGGNLPAPPGQMRYRLGVNCRLGATELAALQRKLIDGLRIAAFSALIFIQDVDPDLLEMLFDF